MRSEVEIRRLVPGMNVYITVDTELTSGLYRRLGASGIQEIFDRSVTCATDAGSVGIDYQMDVLDRHGLKAVFFVDPMPALVCGLDWIERIVQPIRDRGHDIQLHLHSEWLKYATASPVNGLLGNNIAEFDLNDQIRLLTYARDKLVEAGAPSPVAFRAGNYGASDKTLQALASVGIRFDSSFCPGISRSACQITIPRSVTEPVAHCGVIEVPIGAIAGPRGSLRHAQITALSAKEMICAIEHARNIGKKSFTIVSHSFELMSRDRLRANKIVRERFEKVCSALANMQGVTTATYNESPPEVGTELSFPLLPHSYPRTLFRSFEQAMSNAFYGSK